MWIAPLRAAAVGGGLLVVAVVLARAQPAATSAPSASASYYTVRPDPRLCPSPLCGGYWVALANRARTRCSDGASRPRCYVARALGEDRLPLPASLPEGALVRADIEPWKVEGLGDLGALIVAEVRAPVGSVAKGSYYRIRDLGIRCVRAPCFSFRAVRMNGLARMTLSSVDLQPVRLTPDELSRAQAGMGTPSGLFVLGRIVETVDGGRALSASRIYLRAARPRG